MEFKKPTIGISSFLLLLLVSAAAAARPTRQLVANDGTVAAPAVAPAAADVAAGVADAPVAAANADVRLLRQQWALWLARRRPEHRSAPAPSLWRRARARWG